MKQHYFSTTIIICIFLAFYGSNYAMETNQTNDTIISIEQTEQEQSELEQTGWFYSLFKPFNELLLSLDLQLSIQSEEDFLIQILEQKLFDKEEHTQLLNNILSEKIKYNEIEKIVTIINLLHQQFPHESTLIQTNTARLIHNCITNHQEKSVTAINQYISNAQIEIPQMLTPQLTMLKTYIQHSINILHSYKKGHDKELNNFYESYNKCKQTTLALHAISDIDNNEHVSLDYCSDLDNDGKSIHSPEKYTYDFVTQKIQNYKKCDKMVQDIESIRQKLILMNGTLNLESYKYEKITQ